MPATDPILLAGGAIFDQLGTRAEGLGVLVEGERIKKIAPISIFSGYSGQRIDTTGMTVIPGLIDCHVHLLYAGEGDPGNVLKKLATGEIVVRALEHAAATVRGGITAVRDCGGRDYLEFAVRDACNQRRFPGPDIRAAGKMICMTGGHGNDHGRVADGEDDVIRAVREQIHAGCDFVKIMATGGVMTKGVNPEDAHYSFEEISAGINEANRFHRTTASHAQGAEGILNATRGGVTSIEHGIFMNDECIQEMLSRGTYLVPTLAALVNILNHRDEGIPDYVIEKTERCAEAHRLSVRAFYEAGGKIAMGTDAGTPYNLHGQNAEELKFLVNVGLSTRDALIAGTTTAAELLGLDDHGVLREEAVADLIVVDGDPLQDITRASDTTHHQLVMKDGKTVHSRNG